MQPNNGRAVTSLLWKIIDIMGKLNKISHLLKAEQNCYFLLKFTATLKTSVFSSLRSPNFELLWKTENTQLFTNGNVGPIFGTHLKGVTYLNGIYILEKCFTLKNLTF